MNSKFDLLVGSFDRWKKEIVRRSNVCGEACPPLLTGVDLEQYGKRNSLPPVPEVIRLLSLVPRVKYEDLQDDHRKCFICHEDFHNPTHQSSADASHEVPIRLPCGHIFGDVCFKDWIQPFGNGTGCPLCRANHFPSYTGLRITEEDSVGRARIVEGGLDELVWTDHEGGKPVSGARKASVERHRFIMVLHRLKYARDEHTNACPLRTTWEASSTWREEGAEILRMECELNDASSQYGFHRPVQSLVFTLEVVPVHGTG
ncbi:MAG: hypothetical protein Q9163_002203 [Psora crenata]